MAKHFVNFVSPHCHIQSLDSASTPEAFADREIELNTGYMTCTDHGTLQATRKVYDLSRSKGLKPICGVEGYFRDDACPILTAAGIKKDDKGTFTEYSKYFHITLHAVDQEAFETLIRIMSKADLTRSEKHGQERKPILNWADLEELGSKNVTMASSCLGGMVQKHLVDHNNYEIAVAYYEKLRGICKLGNFYIEMFPHSCDHFWQSTCVLTWIDGTESEIVPWKKIKTEKHGETQVQELAKKLKGKILDPNEAVVLLAVMDNRKWVDSEPKKIIRVEFREGFLKNECRPWNPNGDLQEGCNHFMLCMADKYGDKKLISDDAHFTHKTGKCIQDIRLRSNGGSWTFHGVYSRQSSGEAFDHFSKTLGTTVHEFEEWIDNSYAWASKFDKFDLKTRKNLPASFYPTDTFDHTMKLIDKHGRMDWGNQDWVERLKNEVTMLHKNDTIDLLPYFFIAEEAVAEHDARGELGGPGRGSAAGVLLSYLLEITHVDPLRYKLSLERFLTKTRIESGKLPDIDMDFSNRSVLIDPETGWLTKRFGNCQAQIGIDTSLKLRSAVKDVARVTHGRVPDDIEALSSKFQNAPQGIEDSDFIFGYQSPDQQWVQGSIETDQILITYTKLYPEEWAKVQGLLGLTRSKSRHPCGFVICDEPVSNFIPMTLVSGVPVTAYTPKSVEASGGLKMDFLGVNSLTDIRDCIKIVQKRNGGIITEPKILNNKRVQGHRCLPLKNGALCDIWDLPGDQSVFYDFCDGKTETVFQFNTSGALGWLQEFNHVKSTDENGVKHRLLDSIEDLSIFTALDRPGPLDYFVESPDGSRHNMLVEYARRVRGEPPVGNLDVLDKMLPETKGIIIFQEQITRIFKDIGQTSAEEADEFRVHISKKQQAKVQADRFVFDKGAIPLLGEEKAKALWDSMETFSKYSFNISHSTCYVIISYACAYLKHHYPLEWWTAVLRNADKNEINKEFWKYCGHLIDLPEINVSEDQFEIVNERIRAPVALLMGIGEKARSQISSGRPYKDIVDFCKKNADFKTSCAVAVLDCNGNPVMVENKKTKQITPKIKPAHSALNKTVVSTLIISGSMDSLFPSDIGVVDKLGLYFAAIGSVSGKRPEPVPQKYLDMDVLTQFQMKKEVLPAYSVDLLPLIENRKIEGFTPSTGGERSTYFCKEKIPFLSVLDFMDLEERRPWPEFSVSIAMVAYVSSERKFSYTKDGKVCQACEYMLDIEGKVFKVVKWPERKAKNKARLPTKYKNDLTGAIVICILSKYREGRPFGLDLINVVHPPIGSEPKDNETDTKLRTKGEP